MSSGYYVALANIYIYIYIYIYIHIVKAARPVPDGEMFTLSVRHQEYLMQEIFYGHGLRCSAVGQTLIRQGSVS